MNVCGKLMFTLTISKRYKIMKLKSVFLWRKRSHSQTCAAKVARFFFVLSNDLAQCYVFYKGSEILI